MKKVFKDKVKTVDVEMKFTKEVGDFIIKIDDAHREAKNSKLKF